MVVWQSRLIVKLGELYDIEQAELDRALKEIGRQEDRLLAELREDEGNPFVLRPAVTKIDQQSEGLLRHRLRAWTRLCFYGDRPAPGILVTRHRTAMESLQEVYERICRQSPRLLLSLHVPSIRTSRGQDLATDDPLIGSCPSLASAWKKMVAADSALLDEKGMEALVQNGTMEWSQALAALSVPSQRTECWLFDLFLFPGMTAARLFAETFGTNRREETIPSGLAGCVVGMLRAKNMADA